MNEDQSPQPLLYYLLPEGSPPDMPELGRRLAEADGACRLRCSSRGIRKDLLIYVYPSEIAIWDLVGRGTSRYSRGLNGELDRMAEKLAEGLDFADYTDNGEALGPAMLMSRLDYERERPEFERLSLGELVRRLGKLSGDPQLSAVLAVSIKYRHLDGEIRFCSDLHGSGERQYATFLSDERCGWLLRVSSGQSDNWMSATPLGRKQLSDTLIGWILQSPAW